MLRVFCAPARYTQGPHATEELGREICNLGLDGPALIVAGRSAIRLLSDVWAQTFATTGTNYEVFPFGGECTLREIERGSHAARAAKAQVVIGAGGGKVLDTARAIAADLSLPVVNCPTIASSDAPCSALSVIYTEAGEWEAYRIYRRNPDLVLVDTAVIAKSPGHSAPSSRATRRRPRDKAWENPFDAMKHEGRPWPKKPIGGPNPLVRGILISLVFCCDLQRAHPFVQLFDGVIHGRRYSPY